MTGSRGPRDTVSLVGTLRAMRARDVSRPSAEDEASAEATVVVAHRPPRTLPPGEDPQASSGRGGNSPDAS
jgi:hypothetical protein